MVIWVIIVCLLSFETVTRTLTKEMTKVNMLTTLLALENHGKFPGCPCYQASRISPRLPKKIIRTTPPLDKEVVETMTSRLSTPRPVLSPASGGSRCHTSWNRVLNILTKRGKNLGPEGEGNWEELLLKHSLYLIISTLTFHRQESSTPTSQSESTQPLKVRPARGISTLYPIVPLLWPILGGKIKN